MPLGSRTDQREPQANTIEETYELAEAIIDNDDEAIKRAGRFAAPCCILPKLVKKRELSMLPMSATPSATN